VEARVEDVVATAFEVPTDRPESDGMLGWASTTAALMNNSDADPNGAIEFYGTEMLPKLGARPGV
jgi:hypothetical protein